MKFQIRTGEYFSPALLDKSCMDNAGFVVYIDPVTLKMEFQNIGIVAWNFLKIKIHSLSISYSKNNISISTNGNFYTCC